MKKKEPCKKAPCCMDETENVVSACECTGMLPARDDENETLCRMLNVHPQPARKEKKP